MAAPSGIVWGDISSNRGRIGIYTSVSNVDLDSVVTIQVWLWTKTGVSDSNNSFYFDNNATSASTLIGDMNVRKADDAGSNWEEANQVLVASYNYRYTRTSSDKVISCASKFKGIDYVGTSTWMYATATYTIPALPIYTISYDANGGSGAPASQTKVHESAITLSSAIPTRNGYDFLGWNSSSTATTATYSAGGQFTANRTVTLYAVWKAHTYLVIYNANGGSGAPENQTKTHDISLSLATSIPTRQNYNFLGWGTNAVSTSIAYTPGSSYTNNSAITLYAIWELAYTAPRITNIIIERSDADGSALDYGTYISVAFDWETDKNVSGITIQWKFESEPDGWNIVNVTASGISGSVDRVIGSDGISTDLSYDVKVIVEDEAGYTTASKTIPCSIYGIDFLAGGTGAAIGKASDMEGMLEIIFDTVIRKDVIVDGAISASSGDISSLSVDTLYDGQGQKIMNGLTTYLTAGIDPDTTLDHLILTHLKTPNGTFMYIKTEFYASKSEDSNRMQMAFPYNKTGAPFFRRYYNGAWSEWEGMASDDGVKFEYGTQLPTTNLYEGRIFFLVG